MQITLHHNILARSAVGSERTDSLVSPFYFLPANPNISLTTVTTTKGMQRSKTSIRRKTQVLIKRAKGHIW